MGAGCAAGRSTSCPGGDRAAQRDVACGAAPFVETDFSCYATHHFHRLGANPGINGCGT